MLHMIRQRTQRLITIRGTRGPRPLVLFWFMGWPW